MLDQSSVFVDVVGGNLIAGEGMLHRLRGWMHANGSPYSDLLNDIAYM